jgi:hypothetical protein
VSERELRIALDAANARLRRAVEALAPKHKGGEMAEYRAAHEAVLVAERGLAAALGEPYAVPLEFSAQWDIGAPLPYLLQNDYKTFLLFLLADTQPWYDGSFVTIVSPGDANPSNMAIVEFKGCVCSKMGTPNDEVYEGHPLHGKGFVGYRPLRVVNSEWVKELETVNSVHRQYRPERWRTLGHYVFGFHDCTFECVAQSFAVEKMATTIPAALAAICRRLVD